MKIRLLLIIFIGLCTQSFAQQKVNHKFYRSIKAEGPGWARLNLPHGIFRDTKTDLSDIRIYGINASGDTLEAPYLIEKAGGFRDENSMSLKTLNKAYQNKDYSVVVEMPRLLEVNKFSLDLDEGNYEYRVKVEGSQDLKGWFTINEKNRIVALNNVDGQFIFNEVNIPSSKYRYYRFSISSSADPKFKAIRARYESEPVESLEEIPYRIFLRDSNANNIEYRILFNLPVPISALEVNMSDSIDYLRPITISNLDIKRKNETHRYETLYRGTLSSRKRNKFKFEASLCHELKVRIDHGDNLPLKLKTFHAYAEKYNLIVRLPEAKRYILCYGDRMAYAPDYDIVHFKNEFPSTLPSLALDGKKENLSPTTPEEKPLFKNKAWLWAVLGLIIVLLSYFTISMIRSKGHETE